jgi:hypothetical protein
MTITLVELPFILMPDQPSPAAPSPAPAKSGNRVLIIIVCVVLGFFLLVGGCVAGCVYLAAKKAKEISHMAQKNPVFASLSVAASLNPDVEVLSKDEDSGKITVRNKKTGETVTINSNDFTKDTIGQAMEKMTEGAKAFAASAAAAQKAAQDAAPAPAGNSADTTATEPAISAGKAEAMAAILRKFPDSTPAYPGATTVEAHQNALGAIKSGTYVFETTDKLDAVLDFYEKKATAAGFTTMGRNGDTNDFGPTATVSLMHADPQGTITVSAESQAGGRVRVTVNITEAGK